MRVASVTAAALLISSAAAVPIPSYGRTTKMNEDLFARAPDHISEVRSKRCVAEATVEAL